MKELHFTRAGTRMLIAVEGDKRFIIHQSVEGMWMAKVFSRMRPKPIASQWFRNRAGAIDWLARWRRESA